MSSTRNFYDANGKIVGHVTDDIVFMTTAVAVVNGDEFRLGSETQPRPKSELIEHSLRTEVWREYDYGGRVYRIEAPEKLFMRPGGTTHRVLGSDGRVHCVPAPGQNGCALRWKNFDSKNPCEF